MTGHLSSCKEEESDRIHSEDNSASEELESEQRVMISEVWADVLLSRLPTDNLLLNKISSQKKRDGEECSVYRSHFLC